jgi:glycosyltransferase involved in cell wall biosynthesis
MVSTLPAYSALRTTFIGTYVPRQCGIATFTKDLRDAVCGEIAFHRPRVFTLDDIPDGYQYSEEVGYQIYANQPRDYESAADLLNVDQTEVMFVQHEYGIYGGEEGSYVLDLMRRLRMPIITTLHTLLVEPTRSQADVMHKLASLSDRLIVMSHLGEKILQEVYHVSKDKIEFIPHGIPDIPFVDPDNYKVQFGLENRTVILSFGLLSPGKGIEVAIRSMPEIVKKHPHVVYIILGATHPQVFKNEGNSYKKSLEQLAHDLGVRKNVEFHNSYVSLEKLCEYIKAADIYLAPYPNKAQITSGTLAYALGAGKVVVSTPFTYAKEMLDKRRGWLFPFNDSAALSELVNALLGSNDVREATRKKAYHYCRPMVWKEVACSYLRLAHRVIRERERKSISLYDLDSPLSNIACALKVRENRRERYENSYSITSRKSVPPLRT